MEKAHSNMNIYKKMTNSLKWSTFTEILAKLLTPITNMILARLLSPDEFGVLATVTMVISLTDVLTDAGFQKYIIQHVFQDSEELDRATNVAFWSNFMFSMALWGIIAVFNNQIAALVGNPGLGHVIVIAGISMPLTAISSLQQARFRRDYKFKQIFKIRCGALVLPLIVTVPLAAMGLSYWSLIIGVIAGNVYNAVVLTIFSKWKPKRFYSFSILKEMLSYCLWTLGDSMAVWATAWIDTFFIGQHLSDYYLGLYKTSLNTVNGIFTLISSAVTSVLFVSLSKLQNNKPEMFGLFCSFQHFLAMIIIPMGIGLYLFNDTATQILLGSQWSEASVIIGLWALVSIIRICFISLNNELYRASGYPQIPLILQLIDLAILWPTCYYGIRSGFWKFVIIRTIVRADLLIPNFFVLKRYYGVRIIKNYLKYWPILLSSSLMVLVALLLKEVSDTMAWNILSMCICACLYFIVIFIIPQSRKEIKKMVERVLKKH